MQRAAVSDRGRGYGGLRRGLQGPFLSRKLNKRSIGQREMLRRLRNTWIIIALSLSPSLPLSISLSLSFAVSVWRNKEAIKLQTSSAATTTTIRNHSSSFYWRPSSWFGMEKVSLCSSFNRERERPQQRQQQQQQRQQSSALRVQTCNNPQQQQQWQQQQLFSSISYDRILLMCL